MKNNISYHLKLFYRKFSSDGANRITGGKLSAKTILHYHRLISVILHQATIAKEFIILYYSILSF